MDIHPTLPVKTLHWLMLSCLLICSASCNKQRVLLKIDPAFSQYIEGYTSGIISKKNAIRIQLTSDVSTTHTLNETIEEKLFNFSPSVEGKAYWIDSRTIEFKPAKDLVPDALYEVSFALGKVRRVPAKFKDFNFNVQVMKPAVSMELLGLKAVPNSKNMMSFSGQIFTADIEESATVEKLLAANYSNDKLKITWQHNEVNKTHAFIIDGITRNSKAGVLQLNLSGEALHIDLKEVKEIAVPAVGDFKVLAVKAIQDAEEYVLVQFSDGVAYNQDLSGLIIVSEQEDVSYTVNGSEIKLYTANRLDGDYTISVNTGIANEWGNKLSKAFTANVFFENRLPSVNIHGRGTILPVSSGKLVLPFEATNLKAVDVSIIKINENNITQFLQTNDLNGENELRRVAKPLVKATIKLDEDAALNLHKKNRFSLDIDKYIRTEPGAIYRVHIGFRPEYSLYTCPSASAEPPGAAADENEYYNDGENNSVDEDDEFWSRYDNYYPYGYNWDNRDNPCYKSYYNKERFAARNILATNIGLTAKRGNDNSLVIAATHILTTEPMNGIELEVLDYQRQIIGKGKTMGDGMAMLELKQKPYLLVAKNGDEKSYLKLDDGSTLPLSRFDVSGAEVKQGIKGFIFGERGVWRPGDSLFLSCIIEDKAGKLPEDHPIEMDLISPNGQLYKRMIQTNEPNGFNVFRTATDAAAPTGNWLCKVKIGGAAFEKKLKIETVMPNRLKIDLNFGNNPVLGKNAGTPGILTAKWLFGATAKNLKARVDAQLYASTTIFPRFETFTFDNPTINFTPQNKTIFDGPLNEQGSASINPSFDAGTQAPGVLTANLMVKVFEPGGNFSIDNVAYPYHPYNSYMGVKVPEGTKPWGYLLTGKNQIVDIVNVDTKGQLVPGASTAQVELYKIQWRWWWDDTGDNLSNFTQDEYNKLVQKKEVPLVNGKGAYSFKLTSSSWGRYLILVRDIKSGHATGKTFYVDDPYWQNRDNKDDPSAASMLSFTANKAKYLVDEEVTLTIPSSKGGRALISIENGSKVLKTFYTETQQTQTIFKFKTGKEMAPNVYVNVTLLQPHAQTINDLPIRMYGVIPVLIEDKNTLLKPLIKIAESIKPEQQNSITISEANGKDMSYVIAIVDEGLLDLTRFKTPNPHQAFYAKEALGVKSWDMFDYVIGAWGGDLERILTIGGDNEADSPGKKRANRFKPVVQFLGPFTSTGGSKTHTFTLPGYMGSVRAMVIAANKNAYGFAEKNVAVKKPLMLLATIPRVLAPLEEIKIPVTVFATDNNIKNVSLSIQNNAFIEPVGAVTQRLSFATTGEQQVYFNVRVKAATGIGKIRIIASSGNQQSAYEVELDVRNPNPVITNITQKILNANQAVNTTITVIGTGSSSKAIVEVSSIPAINLQKRLGYLIQYPHGCIEQTVSAVFPQLVLNQLLGLTPQQKITTDRNIRRAIDHIQNFQTSEGAFGYWPGYNESDEWGTNYAGHLLLEAGNNGYNVPSGMLQQWRSYQRTKANAWLRTAPVYYGDDLTQAYRLYLLALAKAPELGAMNRLKEYKFISPEAKWRLAAAYYLAGQNGVALQLISGLSTNFSVRTNPGLSYGSQLRDQSMVLETLTIMNRKSEAEPLLRTVANQLATENWYSTQTTAYALIAIAKYCGKNSGNNKVSLAGNINGKNITINTSNVVVQTPVTFQNGKAVIQLTNKGSNLLYLRVINEGQPASGDTMPLRNHPEALVASISFMNTNGGVVNAESLMQGTDFIAKISIKNTGQRGTYNQVALSSIFPGAWEILNTRLYNSEGSFKSSPYEYMDIKDDRVYHYFDIKQNETLTYYVQLNAAYPGRYYWPGIYCEAMYDNTISSGTKGRWIEVKQ